MESWLVGGSGHDYDQVVLATTEQGRYDWTRSATASDGQDVWSLVYGRPSIDPLDLLISIEAACERPDEIDLRTRGLIHDAVLALKQTWGVARLQSVLSNGAAGVVQQIEVDPRVEKDRFPSLKGRLMDKTRPEVVLRFLRELGEGTRRAARIDIGGSTALILAGVLNRATEAIDVVDEISSGIPVEHDLLDGLTKRYGLRLTHFQSHFLPDCWASRVHTLGKFGSVDARVIDVLDIAVGKLFSRRTKDFDDLRDMLDAGHLTASSLEEHMRLTAQVLLIAPMLRASAERNWMVLFGIPLSE